ncbi:acetyl-CoA carboxylase biotin carboxylase subunit [Saccharicrinis fermentans]|uniref:biotin carboxylase n=1 Tax=Saccharicrinis fermentans DSM 9555 = JCM 21142 TaxID=869213 RepID=W7YAS0_9BACT|nr:biotin carboxylase N-terminal domain-containing protein [Saccharicrinis fermentans]GAF01451.1 2-oxoglutarate carboxylase small subunit [Saccharicrinis fermentans DSM 9555 = JCM 21142]
MKINSILIANRGEIAIRIARTAKSMGIKTYMFMSHHEPNALHLDHADEVIDVSDNSFINVYTNIDKLIETALHYKIDAIHPGYGFLSENPFLPRECERNNIIFIGPSSKAINQMGNKGMARDMAVKNKIPVLQGSKGVITTLEEAEITAKDIGYPIILKAVAGGGGKGMRVVRKKTELPLMFKLATNEAKSLFDNDSMLIEKYVENPRHVEFQVLADKHGNIIHLYERECSIQRKHQKLLEEAPSAALTEELRQKIGADAVKICKATNYYSAGTVEFLLDDELNHYFMEMNTRVQVEHPVTEEITGVDIIEQQIRVAQGEELSLKQDDIQINGWAIELRVNAEDVQAGFAPSTGLIEQMDIPNKKYLRCDSGYQTGKVVVSSFDSLVAKLIITGKTRNEAIKNARTVLNSTTIKGVKTTLPFFKQVMQTPSFIKGNYTTSFIDKDLEQSYFQEDNEIIAAAALAMEAYLKEQAKINSGELDNKQVSAWAMSKKIKG